MADEEVRIPPEPQPAGQAMPNRGKRRAPPVIEATAEEIKAASATDEPLATPAADAAAASEAPAEPSAQEASGPASSRVEVSAETSHVPPPAPPRRSRFSALLSALGIVIILLLGAVLYTLYNPPANDAVTELSTETGALKQRLAALEAQSSPAPNLGPLQDRIAALETATGQLKTDLADARSKLDGLATAAPETPAESTAPATPAPAPVDLGPLQSKVGNLEQALAALQNNAAGLQNNVTALQNSVAALPKVDLAPIDAKINDLSQAIGTLQAAVTALPKVDLGPTDAKVAQLGQTLAALQGTVAALPHVDLAPVDQAVGALDHRLASVEAVLSAPKSDTRVTDARQEGSAAETRAAPLAVTAQVVLQALQEGRPFEPAVTALQSLGVDAAQLAPLAAVAAKGAPTDADLLADLAQVRDKMLGAGAPAPTTGNVFDRMLASAQGLVKVRPAGESAGNDPEAVVSRIDADLRRGDLHGSLGEWSKLPDDGKAASQAWADRLKARVDAEDAARAIVAGAITAFGPSK
jgi:hypothetical protein